MPALVHVRQGPLVLARSAPSSRSSIPARVIDVRDVAANDACPTRAVGSAGDSALATANAQGRSSSRVRFSLSELRWENFQPRRAALPARVGANPTIATWYYGSEKMLSRSL